MHRAQLAAGEEVDHPRPDDRDPGLAADARENGVEPAGKSNVVCIHPRHVCPPHDVEADIERPGEPERRVVPDHL